MRVFQVLFGVFSPVIKDLANDEKVDGDLDRAARDELHRLSQKDKISDLE